MIKKTAFILLAFWTLTPWSSSAAALFAGVAFALAFGNPFAVETKRLTPLLLQISIVGLGAGMNLATVGRVGAEGFLYTAAGIALALAAGWALGRLTKVDAETSLLISVGTAICGGSAIAAVAPVIRARNQSVSVALAIVFILNASALLFFPWLGHALSFDQTQFGLFAALAVHDTSSVVGTALRYGPQALDIATTVKLARALWIVPVTFAISFFWRAPQTDEHKKPSAKKPWFILGFLIAAALVTWVPELQPAGLVVATAARRSLVLCLFLIGAGLTRETLRAVGPRPFVQGVALWFVVTSVTIAGLKIGWIH